MATKKTVLVVTEISNQGVEVVRFLSSTGEYRILVLSLSYSKSRSRYLDSLPDVSLIRCDTSPGYDMDAFSAAAEQSDFVFVNTDGFYLGEQAEIYWGIRLFECSVRAGVKHLVYSGLDCNLKNSGYDPRFYVGHYEGKARVQEFIHAQPQIPMAWTIIRAGPSMELLQDSFAPLEDPSGTYLFALPLGMGAIPFIHLEDFGRYLHWSFTNPDQSTGLDFGIATAHVNGDEIASAFTAVTDKPAKYIDIPLDVWHEKAWAKYPKGKETKIGFRAVKDDAALLQTYEENFTNWWNVYRASAGNQGLIQRDYRMLDGILPGRVRSVEDWMRKVGYLTWKNDMTPCLRV